MDALCEGVRDTHVKQVDVVDDFAALFLAFLVFLHSRKVPVGVLPPESEGRFPFLCIQVRRLMRANHGRVLSGDNSALCPGEAPREKDSNHENKSTDYLAGRYPTRMGCHAILLCILVMHYTTQKRTV
ncbi:MAG: hypothetical protein HYU36_11185 [Planctomycetes bacterium]|nr:hypothetical protein [Planctomycetota bacterium]